MRFSGMSLIGAAFVAALCAGSASAHELQRGGNVTCKGPFSNKDNGLGVMARYKSAAKIEEVAGLDGEPFNAVVLFPADPPSRLEIEDTGGSDMSGRVTGVNLKERYSLWSIEGLTPGMTPAELAAANGGPITLDGIHQLSESTFGLSAWLTRGDCTVVVTFYAPKGAHFEHPLYDKPVRTDDPRLAELDLKLDVIILQFPQPPEQ